MEDVGIIDNPISLLKKLQDPEIEFVNLKFTKKDGSIRHMKCTLNFDKIPKADHPKQLNYTDIIKMVQKNKIIHVFDIEKKGWRSIPFQGLKWIITNNNKRYRIRVK